MSQSATDGSTQQDESDDDQEGIAGDEDDDSEVVSEDFDILTRCKESIYCPPSHSEMGD